MRISDRGHIGMAKSWARGIAYIVRDANTLPVAYVYFESEPGRRAAANLMTKDEARKIATRGAFEAGAGLRILAQRRWASQNLYDAPQALDRSRISGGNSGLGEEESRCVFRSLSSDLCSASRWPAALKARRDHKGLPDHPVQRVQRAQALA